MSDIEQIDRDTAAAVIRDQGFSEAAAQDVRDGCKDYTPIVQAFARHRAAAIAAERERLADYLEGYAGGHYMAKSCAAAIRTIATHPAAR